LSTNNPISTAIDEIAKQVQQNINSVQNFLNNFNPESLATTAGGIINNAAGFGIPWYQVDVTIEQLGPDENVLSTITLYDAFISSVNNISYTDETGEISQTEITINYSGVGYDLDQELKL
jgi:hypothetical protein